MSALARHAAADCLDQHAAAPLPSSVRVSQADRSLLTIRRLFPAFRQAGEPVTDGALGPLVVPVSGGLRLRLDGEGEWLVPAAGDRVRVFDAVDPLRLSPGAVRLLTEHYGRPPLLRRLWYEWSVR